MILDRDAGGARVAPASGLGKIGLRPCRALDQPACGWVLRPVANFQPADVCDRGGHLHEGTEAPMWLLNSGAHTPEGGTSATKALAFPRRGLSVSARRPISGRAQALLIIKLCPKTAGFLHIVQDACAKALRRVGFVPSGIAATYSVDDGAAAGPPCPRGYGLGCREEYAVRDIARTFQRSLVLDVH